MDIVQVQRWRGVSIILRDEMSNLLRAGESPVIQTEPVPAMRCICARYMACMLLHNRRIRFHREAGARA